MAFTYILKCHDDSYYVGSTRNLEFRLWQHNEGLGADYTRRRLPVELVWSVECEHVGEAFWLEKRIQGWSRAKREAIIRGDFDALRLLAKRPSARG
jgi:putative endonuclease